MRVAVIGAGIAGLACADDLRAAGANVVLFDKGRGPGGRMSTRRLQTPLGEVSVDHGAQYFTAREPSFLRQVAGWSGAGIAEPWPLAGADAWVGVPGMSAVVREMACNHDVNWNCLIRGLVRRDGKYWLFGVNGESGPYDAAVLAIPAEQAAVVLSLHDLEMTRLALGARSQPCWTAMFAFDRPLHGLPHVIRSSGAIAWAACNTAKPRRTGLEAWVVQASAAWSSERLEWMRENVAEALLREFSFATVTTGLQPIGAEAHLWRYALSAGIGDGALWNPGLNLGACGDWLLGPRVECAWLSGKALARKMNVSASDTPALAETRAQGARALASVGPDHRQNIGTP